MTLGPNNQCSTNELATSKRSFEMWLWTLPTMRKRQLLLRKEVIQPHLPVRLPCYDFTPIINQTLNVERTTSSGPMDFRGVTGGVYKARERIHRSLLICDY